MLSAAATLARAATAVVLLAIALSIFRLDWVPLPLAAALCATAVLAALNPPAGLVVVAASTPVAMYALRRWNPGVAWAEVFVVLFAAGWFVRRLTGGRGDPSLPPALRVPVWLFAAVVLASTIVQMSVDRARLGWPEFAAWMLRYFTRDFFVSGSDRYLHAAAFFLEGLLLFAVAARAAAASGRKARRVAGALAVAGAAAAALNLHELIASARRFDAFWGMLWQHIATARLNVHYADVNAAGSAFALLLFVSAGVAAARSASRWWAGVVLLTTLGLWMSGSRTALMACPMALTGMAALAARQRAGRRGRIAAGLGAAILLAAVVAVVYAPTRGNQQSSSVATQVRVEMAHTTARMVRERPLFGIGLGQFYQRSGEFSSPALLAIFPRAQHENAHNNFLQILGETGVVGLGVFLWLLAAALRRGAAAVGNSRDDVLAPGAVRTTRADALGWGTLAGATVFLLTCLGGHPLLTREAAYAFWIVLGLATGLGLSRAAPAPLPLWLKGLAALVVVSLVGSIPWQVAAAKAHADFEHLGIGVSEHWETSDDGVRYRGATTTAALFVPGETAFRFSVQQWSAQVERLELRLDGRVADIVTLPPRQWVDVTIQARSIRPDARFSRLDLRILDAGERAVTIRISKVQPLGPQ